MKNLILTLVLGASFGVSGAFAATSTLPSNPPSPTSSVKAKKLLEGTDATIGVATDSPKAQELLGRGDSAAKIEANRARRAARLNVARKELEVAKLEASEFEQNSGQIAAEAG